MHSVPAKSGSSAMTITYPYLGIPKAQQLEIARELKLTGASYKAVLQVMTEKAGMETLTPEQVVVLNDLNDRVYESPWTRELPNIQNLTGLCDTGFDICTTMGSAAFSLAVYYARTHKLIALVSGCVTVAFLMLGTATQKIKVSFWSHEKHIEDLTWRNEAGFSGKADGVYAELKRTSYLMRYYLAAQTARMQPEHQGLQLLRQQLAAFGYLKNLLPMLLSPCNPNATHDVAKIQSFFRKVEPFSRKAFQRSATFSALALGWALFAYTQKAYYMAAVGIVHCVGALVLARSFNVLTTGSKKIYESQHVENNFDEMMCKIFFNEDFWPQLSGHQIENAVVIPFNAILQLIPSWNDDN